MALGPPPVLEARCRRGLPGTGGHHSEFETDTRGLLDGHRLGLFLLFYFSVQRTVKPV